MNSLYLRRMLVLTILAGALALAVLIFPQATPQAHAASVLIDTFADAQSVSQTGVGSLYGDGADAAIMGGHRNVTVTVLSGTTVGSFTSNSPAGKMSGSNGPDASSIVTLTYDADATAGLNKAGLGSRDLTDGSNNSAIVYREDVSDFTANITIMIWSDAGTKCSKLAKSSIGGVQALVPPTNSPPIALIFRFTDFAGWSVATGGCGTAAGNKADFTKVSAVQVVISAPTAATDYTYDELEANGVDRGDLPDTSYRTTVLASGPGHVITDFMLGTHIDNENDGQPTANANGDDKNGTVAYPPGDEDGVKRVNLLPWPSGVGTGSLNVTVSGHSGCLMGWIDWDNSATFDIPADTIFDNVLVNTGTTLLTFDVPALPGGSTNGQSFYARFRLYPTDITSGSPDCHTDKTSGGGTSPEIFGGEVEDYVFGWMPTAVTLNSMTATAETNSAFPFALAGLAGLVVLGAVVLVRRRK